MADRHQSSPPSSTLLRRTGSLAALSRHNHGLLLRGYAVLASRVSPFWIQLAYFLSLDLLGSAALMSLRPVDPTSRPKYVDMLYLSTSAVTVSGLATVEMEVLSPSQVAVYTLLMLLGGEVWVSLLGILARLPKLGASGGLSEPAVNGAVGLSSAVDAEHGAAAGISAGSIDMKYRCLRMLALVVFSYILVAHVAGFLSITLYVGLVGSAKAVLKGKRISPPLFAVATAVSSFANAGLIPTNENMMVFKGDSGLLLLMVLLILVGNTLFPVVLRLLVWALGGLTGMAEFDHMLKSPRRVGYPHLMPGRPARFLALTVAVFLAVQMALFCALEWTGGALAGLGRFQKVVASLFQTANSRHAGEAAVDLSMVSPAVLVLFIVMMYLPAYTSFHHPPGSSGGGDGGSSTARSESRRDGADGKRRRWVPPADALLLSQASYVAIFVVALCVVERKKMAGDPLNFSVLNMVFEVTSAYGNVGLSLGYSCARRIGKVPGDAARCRDAWYGFSGHFGTAGKLVIVFVMLFGRMKKFHMGGGKAWKLL